MKRTRPEPLFSDGFALSEWLLARLGHEPGVLERALCAHALEVLENIVLALEGFDREHHASEADRLLLLLRVELRLAAAVDCLSERQTLHALDIADRIGRQLGGWLRTMEVA